jgi:HAD superfamily hydrolase (TIGR01490 family)
MIPLALTGTLQHAAAHIFDVDHTLTRHSTGRRFAQVGYRDGLFTLRFLLTLPGYYARYRLGILDIGHINRELQPLTGHSRARLTRIAHTAWTDHIKKDLYTQAVEYIQACHDRGATVILASTSLDIILTPLARHLSADATIASELEFSSDGNATGWLTGGPCYAASKAERINTLLNTRGIAPQHCAFYSDSYHDLPSLELVGFPVAVHPDIPLRTTAKRRGWPVITWNH